MATPPELFEFRLPAGPYSTASPEVEPMTRRYVVRRIGLAVLTAYLLLTVTFGFAVITPDPTVAQIKHDMARGGDGASAEEIREAVREYEESRNLDDPLGERYARWLVAMATFDWGASFTTGRPVTEMVAHGLRTTLTYVLPAVVLSAVGGIAVGLYSSVRGGTVSERLGTLLGYAGLGVPSFWIAAMLELVLLHPLYHRTFMRAGPSDPAIVARIERLRLVFAAVALGLTLFAGQLRYAQAEAREHAGTDFVKVLRAKGAGATRITRHVLRNAAIPFVTLFFTDVLAVLVVNVYVLEYVLGIDGIGMMSLRAIQARDTPVIIGTTMAIVFIGIVGNLVQDLTQTALDPRIDHER